MRERDRVIDSFIANPSTNIVDVLSSSGYTLEAAIADIIDNSIAAKAKHIDVMFEIDGLDSRIIITDDGFGMNESKLHDAIIYAHKNVNDVRDITDIGRYSIGLNSASSSFCNFLFLTSKLENGSQHSIAMDFNYLRSKNEWRIFNVQNREDALIETKSGTIVIWEDLKLEKDDAINKNLLSNDDAMLVYINRVEKHLAKVFFRFIKFFGVHISVNGSEIEGWDPFFRSNANTQKVFDDVVSTVNGSPIKVEGYVLPVAEHLSPQEKDYEYGFDKNLQELQGFYLYRGDRLISIGGWLNIEGLNIDPKSNYARIGIYVDNTLDKYLSVNFIKNSINVPQELADILKPIAKDVRKRSVNNFEYKKKPRPYKKNKDISIKPWIVTHTDLGVKASINAEHPIIKSICANLTKTQRNMLFNLLSKSIPIGDFENYHGLDDSYSDEEMLQMLELKYNEFKKANLTKKEILEQFQKISPYCEEKYRVLVYEFMDGKDDD